MTDVTLIGEREKHKGEGKVEEETEIGVMLQAKKCQKL